MRLSYELQDLYFVIAHNDRVGLICEFLLPADLVEGLLELCAEVRLEVWPFCRRVSTCASSEGRNMIQLPLA